MERIEFKIISEITDYFLNKVVQKVIYDIHRTPKEAMTSGDDTSLKSVWEELCVQVQDDHFDSWDLLDDMVKTICTDRFEELPYAVQVAISYEASINYRQAFDEIYSDSELAADLIKEKVYDVAINYENKNIKKYLNW